MSKTKRRVLPFLLTIALLLPLMATSVSAAPAPVSVGSGTLIQDLVIANHPVVGYTTIATGMTAGSQIYGDRPNTWAALPAHLNGAEWIQTGMAPPGAADQSPRPMPDFFMHFTAGANIAVYVAVDYRNTGHNLTPAEPPFEWLEGWELTNLVARAFNYDMLIYRRTFANGSLVEFGPQGNSHLFYVVMVLSDAIGGWAFEGGTLTLTSNEGTTAWRDERGVAFQPNNVTNIVIGSDVTAIGNEAFMGTAVASVTIPDSVTSIGASAFANIPTLASVTMQRTIPPTMGANAFANSGLGVDSITIPVVGASLDDWVSAFANTGIPANAIEDPGVPPTNVSDITWTMVSMFALVGVSAALWVAVGKTRKKTMRNI